MPKAKLKPQATVVFMPVLHSGYLDFIKKSKGDIYIFGKEIINSYEHLTRDLRLVDPKQMASILGLIFPYKTIKILDKKILKSFHYKKIILPEDEISSDLAEKYFSQKEVIFEKIFLRWNKIITFREFEVPANREITQEKFHKEMLDLAYKESQKSADWWRQVGSIILKDGRVVASSHNHHLPTDFHLSQNGDPRSNFNAGENQNIFTSIHSEAEAIALAAKKGISLDGAVLYVTTFPCPNCARLIGTSGIKKVYYKKGYSLLDAEKILNHFGVEVILVGD